MNWTFKAHQLDAAERQEKARRRQLAAEARRNRAQRTAR